MQRLRWVDAEGRRLPVLVGGDPAAPPAVLVPGLSDGLTPVSLPATQALLREVPLPLRHFFAIAVSYGDRQSDEPPPSTADLADEVAGALEQLSDRPAWLLAHSMGAMVAQHLAATRPDLVAGLVLSATTGVADERLRTVLTEWQDAVVARDWTGFARAALDASYTGREHARRQVLLRAAPPPGHPDDRIARHVALTAAALHHDAREVLGDIARPTLVLSGEHDPLCPPDAGRTLAAAIPGARFAVLDGLAHGFPEQAPRRFAGHVLDFLAAAGAPGIGSAPSSAAPR
ncbi:alpha/beta fold hydrolase [Egicoccus halophilus]|uniref:AB hydrolase-1 domain-containing protein n=1 Tax=Egicoccus halophilus TaxID=1670830 RepID=A0A8J3AC73_9ACTN|nr:alpha/beta fold hydrolase [Egicoccus halophilus]GGI08330.1 hypothetical protein GCM10011354_28550 [Egicoccus halophilus]